MLVFYDTARGRDNSPQRNIELGLASVGMGIRLNRGRSWAIQLDWAHVTKAAGSRAEGSQRAHFTVGYGF
jgi:hemolysin activation/secretion protein